MENHVHSRRRRSRSRSRPHPRPRRRRTISRPNNKKTPKRGTPSKNPRRLQRRNKQRRRLQGGIDSDSSDDSDVVVYDSEPDIFLDSPETAQQQALSAAAARARAVAEHEEAREARETQARRRVNARAEQQLEAEAQPRVRRKREEEEEEEKETPEERQRTENMARTWSVNSNERDGILKSFYRLFNSWGYEPLPLNTCKPSYFESASHEDGVEYQAFSDPLMRSLSKVAHYEPVSAHMDILAKFQAASNTAQAIKAKSLRQKQADTKYTHYMALLAEFKSQKCETRQTNYDLLKQLARYNYRRVHNVSYLFVMLVQSARLLLAAVDKKWDAVIALDTDVRALHEHFLQRGGFN
jgi:hypothetical protein